MSNIDKTVEWNVKWAKQSDNNLDERYYFGKDSLVTKQEADFGEELQSIPANKLGYATFAKDMGWRKVSYGTVCQSANFIVINYLGSLG